MKKIIILTAVTSVLLVTGQQAWANTGDKGRQDNDDYRTFKKIVGILNVLINDDHHNRRKEIIVRKYSFPKRKVCYYKGPYEVCRLGRYGHNRHGFKSDYKKHLRRK